MMKAIEVLIGCVSLSSVFIVSSQASVIASDRFDYTDGALDGQNGGTGFEGAWVQGSVGLFVADGVVSPSSGVGQGNFRRLSAAATAKFAVGETVWISLDYNNSGGSLAYGGLSLYVDGDERVIIGNTSGANSYWGLGGGVDQHSSRITAQGMRTGVARVTVGAGATSMIDLWVGDNAVDLVDVSGAADVSIAGVSLAGVDQIRIQQGAAGYLYDNIIIGESYVDIPEPRAYALLVGLVCLAGVVMRRRSLGTAYF